MQQKNNNSKRVLAVLAALFVMVSTAMAQTSSINAFSPYTMYGIGEINTPGTLASRSMGGVGVAARQTGMINLLNPAGFSLVTRKSFLLNVGMEGQNYYNSQTVEGVSKKSAYNSFNVREFSFLVPLGKGLGLGFSVTPYSSVGYRTMYDHFYDETDPVWGNVGRVNYSYQGEGDVTEVKVYTNCESVTLYANGEAVETQSGKKICVFRVRLEGKTHLEAVAGDLRDEAVIQYSPIPDPSYKLSRKKAGGGNWTAD